MNKQLTLRRSVVISFTATILSMLAFSAEASLVTNGSFENTSSGPNKLLPDTMPTGWNYAGGVAAIYSPGAADLIGTNVGPIYLWGPANPPPNAPNGLTATSPDGGNFLASDSDSPFSGEFSQTINGLTPGNKYVLTFLYAAAQFRNPNGSLWNGASHSLWRVRLGGAGIYDTPDLNIADHGFSGWMGESHTFTIPTTSTGSEVLRFLAVGGPGGLPPVALLDGVSLVAVPEPETLTLLGVGLLGVLLTRRQQRTCT